MQSPSSSPTHRKASPMAMDSTVTETWAALCAREQQLAQALAEMEARHRRVIDEQDEEAVSLMVELGLVRDALTDVTSTQADFEEMADEDRLVTLGLATPRAVTDSTRQ